MSSDRMTTDVDTVVAALDVLGDIVDRGYTFADEKGRESFIPFRDLAGAVRRRCAALQALGLSKGDRLALIIPDHESFIVTFLAGLAAGLVPVPMYPPLSLAKLETWTETAGAILRAANVAAIVTVEEILVSLWSMAAPLRTRVVTVAQLANEVGTAVPVKVTPDDIAFLQFTSGSTKAP